MLLLAGDGAKERPSIIWSVVTAEAARGWNCGPDGQKGTKEHQGIFFSGERTWPFRPGLFLILDVLRNKPGGRAGQWDRLAWTPHP